MPFEYLVIEYLFRHWRKIIPRGGLPPKAMATRNKDVADKTSAGTQTKGFSGRGPVYDAKKNRVRLAIFRKVRDSGEVVYDTAINRSYQDEDKQWHNTDFYSKDDLTNVIEAAKDALDQIDRFEAREQEHA